MLNIGDCQPVCGSVAVRLPGSERRGIDGESPRSVDLQMATYIQYHNQDEPGLYLVQPRADPPPTCDIFFVHGLDGGPTRSWRHPNGVTWFRDLLPAYIADNESRTNARIWTFGYNAGKVFSAKSSIDDHAGDLVSRVKGVMDGHTHHKIIWVCHSLGGLVVKSALIEAHLNQEYRSILNSTIGILFLGTPHRGANGASWATTLARIAKKTMLVRPPTELLRALEKDSEELYQNLHRFVQICQGIKIYSFRETLPMGSGMVVDKSSAFMDQPGEVKQTLNANHVGLCKFEGHNDQKFVVVCDAIKRLTNSTNMRPQAPIGQGRPLPLLPSPANIVPSSPGSTLIQPINMTSMAPVPSNAAQYIPMQTSQPSMHVSHVSTSHHSTMNQQLPNSTQVPGPQFRDFVWNPSNDVPGLVHVLSSSGPGDVRNNAAQELARISRSADRRDRVADAVAADHVPLLVECLTDSGPLRLHALIILANVIRFDKVLIPVLNAQAIPIFIDILSAGSLDEKVYAATALANITRNDVARQIAATRAIPPLTLAIGSPELDLKRMAIRAMRNIIATNAGARAASDPNSVRALAALVDESRFSPGERHDVVCSLEMLTAGNRAVSIALKQAGLIEKLKKYQADGIHKQLREAAIILRQRLKDS